MIFEQEDNGGALNVLQEYAAPTSEAFSLGMDEAFSDNPFNKLMDYGRVEQDYGQSKFLNPDEVKTRMKARGVDIKDLPENGLAEDSYKLLEDRAYQKKVRAEALSSMEGGGFQNFSGGLIGSFMDPINIVSGFIPVVGEARYAQILGRASGALSRTAVRAGVGVAEGAVGAIAIEPLNYALSKQLGDDYTMAHSLMNIGFGAVMGGAMHAGGGLIKDAVVGAPKNLDIETRGPVTDKIESMSPEARTDAMHTAVAQALEDRTINVEPVIKAHDAAAARRPIPREERLAIAREIDPETYRAIDDIQKDTEALRLEAEAIKEKLEVESPEAAKASDRLEEIQQKLYDQTDDLDTLQKLGEEEIQILEKFSKEELALAKKVDAADKTKLMNQLDTLEEKISELKKNHGALGRKAAVAYREAGKRRSFAPEKVKSPTDPELKMALDEVDMEPKPEVPVDELNRLAIDEPGSNLIDITEPLRTKEILDNAKIKNADLDEAKAVTQDDVNELMLEAKQVGADVEPILKAADEEISRAVEFGETLQAWARCLLRKGS